MTPSTTPAVKLIQRRDGTYEQLVMGEVLVPDVPNVYGDIYTREAIVEFCYEFARQGYGIDIDHDQKDVTGTHAYVVQSFIVRPGDPDFIEGAWVIGMKIPDQATWQRVLSGDLAGYSFEALCSMEAIQFQNLRNRYIEGFTEPDPVDQHVHAYLVITDIFNNVVSGGTSESDGHVHTISTHTVTDDALASNGDIHAHRFQVIVAGDSEGE